MSAPRISVVIPAYNQAKYLAETIDSVQKQTYADREIIVVDDGSTDETAEIAKGYGESIRYVYQENQGLAGARNTGISLAQGEFVALLDSDDYWASDFLAKMISLADRQATATVYYCGVQYISSDGRVLEQKSIPPVYEPAEFSKVMLRNNFLVPSATVLRRQPVIDAGMFDIDYRRLQDWELWVRLLKSGKKFAGIAAPLVYYRLHDASLSTDPQGGERAATAMVQKHFGDDDGNWHAWEAEKRIAYGGLYRYIAITSSLLRQGNWARCAEYLQRAFQVDPSIALDTSLYYELALGEQPLGVRGTQLPSSFDDNLYKVEQLLQQIFESEQFDKQLLSLYPKTKGLAYFSFGLLARNFGKYLRCNQLLLKALQYRPQLVLKRRFTSTFVKSLLKSLASQLLQRGSYAALEQ